MSWICDKCETENSDELLYCEVCGEASPKYIEEKAWNHAIQTDTEASYHFYITNYPSGLHLAAANNRLKVLAKNRKRKEDNDYWDNTVKENTIEAYQNYIKHSEQKEHINEANQIIDSLRWKLTIRTNTESAYKSYLKYHPEGKYADDARRKLKGIERKRCIGKTIKRLFWSGVIVSLFLLGKAAIENHQWVLPLQNFFKGSQESNSTNTYPTTTKQSESQPHGSAGESHNIDSFEKELETKLRGMEMAKRYGDPINHQTLNETESLLNKVKSSSKYNYYRQKINSYKQRTNCTSYARLKGRNTLGAIPSPDYTEEHDYGTVVVDIWVDNYGKVTKAVSGGQGTTVNNSKLWAAARTAALQTHFNQSADAPALQLGTITYVFKLK